MKLFSKSLTSLIILLAFGLVTVACDQNSNISGPDDTVTFTNDVSSLAKKGGNNKGKVKSGRDSGPDEPVVFEPYVYSGSVTIKYDNLIGGYESAKIDLEDGSVLKIKEGRLIAPQGYGEKQPVKITMQVERTAEGELFYTFGPHGCQFTKSAEICFSYANISGSGKAKLYYIKDNGEYKEQRPDQIDRKGSKMYLEVDHFSRYAIAYGR